MSNKKVNFGQVAEIDMEHYFGKGKGSLLKRETDLNSLLLQLTIIVNKLSSFYNLFMESPLGAQMERLKEIRDREGKK